MGCVAPWNAACVHENMHPHKHYRKPPSPTQLLLAFSRDSAHWQPLINTWNSYWELNFGYRNMIQCAGQAGGVCELMPPKAVLKNYPMENVGKIPQPLPLGWGNTEACYTKSPQSSQGPEPQLPTTGILLIGTPLIDLLHFCVSLPPLPSSGSWDNPQKLISETTPEGTQAKAAFFHIRKWTNYKRK